MTFSRTIGNVVVVKPRHAKRHEVINKEYQAESELPYPARGGRDSGRARTAGIRVFVPRFAFHHAEGGLRFEFREFGAGERRTMGTKTFTNGSPYPEDGGGEGGPGNGCAEPEG